MTTPSLKLLLELTQQQTNSSAKKLGRLNLQEQEAEEKLNLLLQYRHNYRSRLQNSIENGIDHIEWLNFIAFMDKLDAAITEQHQAVSHARNKRLVEGNEFLFRQRKLKSYETLSQRQQNTDNQRQIKYEQKLQDEFAANAFNRSSFPAKDT